MERMTYAQEWRAPERADVWVNIKYFLNSFKNSYQFSLLTPKPPFVAALQKMDLNLLIISALPAGHDTKLCQ